ncbi:uncharacterized protein LOC123880439 isoform X1 [Maniola jurtina]|uniref:uncharacterized protein LOC123880439 isoform X1 n=1 Tax=Maniola jurtina TaxID=191418 RepID=UPI001E68B825|nr:uncharacterized protein LOC123880439 isoform X1 [Maniola jurtina]
MPPRRKVSVRQYELLVEFAETHRDIAMGRYAGGPLGNQAARQAWQTLALQLNAVGEGVSKSAEQWRRYWIELKAKIKNKAADSRRMARGTGGGPNRLLPLTPIEERILSIIGKVAVQGLEGVQIPLDAPTTNMEEEDSPSILGVIDITPNIDGPTIDIMDQRDSERGDERSLISQNHSVVNQLVEDHTSQAEEATEPAEDRARQQDSQNRRATTARNSRPIRQDVNVPNWAYQLETRRLENEERHTETLSRMADCLVQLTAAVREIADGVAEIKNLISELHQP